MPDAIECEHLHTQVGYDDELQSGRDPDEDDEHADFLRRFRTVCAEMIWLCKPIVAAAGGGLSKTILEVMMLDVEVLAGVVTRGLRL